MFMKPKLFLAVAFIAGITIGAFVAYLVQAIKFQNFLALEQQMDIYKSIEKCDQAYFTKSPDIAVWEIESFLSDEESEPQTDEYKKIHYLDSFVAHARLAKLYKNLGDENKAEQHFGLAMTNYNLASAPKGVPLTNDVNVLDNLEKFDAKALKTRGFAKATDDT